MGVALPIRRCAAVLAALALPALLLAACTTTQGIDPVETNPAGFAQWTDAPIAYRFGPGDKVKVQFLLTPELGEDTVVEPDGTIALRATGHVRAVGLTAVELEEAIAQASRRVLRNPVVTVSLNDPGAAVVFVGGSVRKPGAYPIPGRRGLLEAIVLANGFEAEARMNQVVLIRRNPENRPMLRTVNLQQFASTALAAGDVPLAPGDIVFVPRNRISEIGLWIDQFVNRVIPFNRSFSYAINRNNPGNLL